jgi:hypothetical protein
MYDGWNKSVAHSVEWSDKIEDFVERVFSLSSVVDKIRCSCVKCQAARFFLTRL